MKRSLVVLLLLFNITSTATARINSSTARWPAVPQVNWSRLKPADFGDVELDPPYYLAQFHLLANSVVESGEKNRGFIDLAVRNDC
jgi:hypothetical protein